MIRLFLVLILLLQPQSQEQWTCSMHPQIRMPDNSQKCPICYMDLIPLDEKNDLGSDFIPLSSVLKSQIRTQEVVLGRVDIKRSLRARVVANDAKMISHSLRSEGRIEELKLSRAGMLVTTGDVLYSLYSPSLISAQQDYLEALKLQGAFGLKQQKDSEIKLLWLGYPKDKLQDLKQAGYPLEHVPIHATFSGIVTEVFMRSGAYGELGKTVFSVLENQAVYLEAYLSERDLQELKAAKSALFLPIGQARELIVDKPFLEEIALGAARSFRQLWHLKDFLPLGLEGLLKVHIQSKEGSVLPNSALLFAGSDAVVYQVIDDLVQARKVKILASGEEYSLIDIEPGAVVVSEAAFAVDSEFQIQGKTSLIKKLEEHKFGFNTQYQSSEGLNALSKDQESRNLAEHLIGDYLNLWQFLSQDDLPQSRNAAEIFDNRLAHTQHPSAVWLIRQLSEEPDLETLPALRNRFHKISELFLKIGELGLLQGMNLKRAYCPMAFDSQGAEWIQKGEKVINPYFGNSMLHCGSIREDF